MSLLRPLAGRPGVLVDDATGREYRVLDAGGEAGRYDTISLVHCECGAFAAGRRRLAAHRRSAAHEIATNEKFLAERGLIWVGRWERRLAAAGVPVSEEPLLRSYCRGGKRRKARRVHDRYAPADVVRAAERLSRIKVLCTDPRSAALLRAVAGLGEWTEALRELDEEGRGRKWERELLAKRCRCAERLRRLGLYPELSEPLSHLQGCPKYEEES